MIDFKEKANLIWAVADLLRGDYKQADYGKVILPMTVLRRLDCVLEPTKQKVLNFLPKVEKMSQAAIDATLNKIAGFNFHNRSQFNFKKLVADPNNIAANLRNFINGFSASAREIIEYFNFDDHISRMDDPQTNLLYLVVKRFEEIELSNMSSIETGYVFEELIRRFAELSNETAGEHFTPREVIRLMVNLLFLNDREILTKKGIVKTLYDLACGTGGMLSIPEEYLQELNPDARLEVFGQEINPESYAICKSDMLIKGQNPANIKFGNTFTVDGLEYEKFDYMLSNPPFGVEWRKAEKIIKTEHENKGFAGRFGAGLPRINDGSFLFLQHMISKMKPSDGGSRIGIIFNGSPLFTGGAGSGESEIRKWIIENDMLEAIVALPDQLFYNTGIATYILIVTNRKNPERKGKIQLINATGQKDEDDGRSNRFWLKMARSLGNKRKEIGDGKYGKPDQIGFITKIYGDFRKGPFCKIFPNEYFAYWRVTVEQPLKDANGRIETDKNGNPKPDSNLRDYENIPFLREQNGKMVKQTIEEYFEREVKPHLSACVHAQADAPDLPAPRPSSGQFCIYVLKCLDDSFYIGQTEDFEKRLNQHNRQEVSWTASRLPVEPIHWEIFGTREEAVKREQELKTGFGRKWLIREYDKGTLVAASPACPEHADRRQAGAWIDESKTKVGYEINFTKYFYEFKPLRSLEEIQRDILALEQETEGMIKTVIEE